jgi:hypothetical protein
MLCISQTASNACRRAYGTQKPTMQSSQTAFGGCTANAVLFENAQAFSN